MSTDYFNPPNSVWPNGLKRDEEGYWIPVWTETDTQLICNWVETVVSEI